MSGSVLFRAFLGFAVLLLVAAAPPGSVAVAQTASEAASETQVLADGDIQMRIRSQFREIDGLKNVRPVVRSGVVTLRGTVLEIGDIAQAEELARKVEGVVEVNNAIEVEKSVEKRLTPALERFQDRLSQFVTALPLIAVGIIVFVLVGAIGFLIARLKKPWDSITPNQFVADLLRQLIRIAFVLLGIVIALDIVGATALLGTVLGAAGILGLALGFAVRDTVENYIASILLSFRQPFRPRDVVQIDGHEGHVIALTSRATVLMTYDGNHVRIPNANVFKGVITNFTRNPERRISFKIGVETEDLKQAIALGLDTINALPFMLDDPAPDGWIDEIGDSAMILWFGGWIDQDRTHVAKARSEAIRQVKMAFEAAGIGLPEPIYRLRFDQGVAVETGDKSRPGRKISRPRKPQVDRNDIEDTSAETDIDRKIIEEQIKTGNGDLLDEDAPHEIGG